MGWTIWRMVWPYLLAVSAAGATYWYIHHRGEEVGVAKCEAAQTTDLKAQLLAQQTFAVAADDLKKNQLKEAGDANKEVDSAYQRGCVPQRVRKFYIDTPPRAC